MEQKQYMQTKAKAARAVFCARIGFLLFILVSLFLFALSLTGEGRGLWAIGGGAALVLGAACPIVGYTLAGKWLATLPKEQPVNLEDVEGVDLDFVLQVREYNVAQLHLILDEQKDLYTADEIAYIEKVLSEKEKTAQ